MFSATWPSDVRKMADNLLTDATHISVGERGEKLAANVRVDQTVRVCDERGRMGILQQYLRKWCKDGPGKEGKIKCIIFGLYKKSVERLLWDLKGQGWNVGAVHGNMNQSARNGSLQDFKDGKVPLLVATDVAARGLDIDDVDYVFNYEFPLLCEDWVHRTGRTGRAGKTGVAVTLFTWDERKHARELRTILQASGTTLDEEFEALADKAPPTIRRKSNADRMYGMGAGRDDRPMPKSSHVSFD